MAEIATTLVLLIFLIVLALRYAGRRGREMAMLMSRGTEVTGEVIDVRRVRRSRTHKGCRVRYRFSTTGGIRYEREIEVRPKEFADYSKGQDITIVYDPANPKINMLGSAVNLAREARDKQRMQQTGEPT